jgi:biopolymer transport protein ExbB/TolQ
MLGLMATLISLGPGLTALSNGSLGQLAEAMLTAFDTTVLGLAAGVVGFIIGRLRRRWYDEALTRWERES